MTRITGIYCPACDKPTAVFVPWDEEPDGPDLRCLDCGFEEREPQGIESWGND